MVKVNDLSGEILTCSENVLRIFTVNGHLLGIKTTSTSLTDPITALAYSRGPEWLDSNIILTGHRNGNIKAWSLMLVRRLKGNDLEGGGTEIDPTQSNPNTNSNSNTIVLPQTADGVDLSVPYVTGEVDISIAAGATFGQGDRRIILRQRFESHRSPVTTVFVSPDQKKIISGDEDGKVVQWQLPEAGELVSWVPDEEKLDCEDCGAKFTLLERRHHCRKCGGIFCNTCSDYRLELNELGFQKPVRVCRTCFSTRG